ncbi:MAG: Crp/Fnr family transcriptional regulator [Burkholderiaceae bacterium]|nr:Crp/Fnr family transcriptional regulator [Burkholderiaceae bacterium]
MSYELGPDTREIGAGEPVLLRGAPPESVLFLQSGRVTLGLLDGRVIGHRFGAAEGPCWLDAGAAVLGLPGVVDAVAETAVTVRRVPLAVLRSWFDALPPPLAGIVHDVARAHRQQAELAVSRLAKDAEARCAEWLLRHAEPCEGGHSTSVRLVQHKRLIAAQLGIAPETFSRVLRHLRERELISGSGRVLNLTDPGRLRQLAGI